MISNPDSLFRAISIKKGEIEPILSNIDDYYYEYKKKKPNKQGLLKLTKYVTQKVRVINPSIKTLKIVQKHINKMLNENIPPTPYAFGSVKKHSGISNGQFHKGNKFIFQTDLRGFFPSITSKDVYRTFTRFGFSPDVASILTKLTTYKGHIPQGAPTSSTVANLVFTKTGNVIADFCAQNGLRFSTYVDDLTISGPYDFQDMIPQILDIVRQGGYTISHAKTTYRTNRPNITGVSVGNNYIDITDKFKEKIKDSQGKTEEQIAGELNYKDLVFKSNKPSLKTKSSRS